MSRSLLLRFPLQIMLLAALTTFTSCLESNNPVTDAKQGGRDQALCGAWKYKDKDGTLWVLQFGYLDGQFKSPWMGCTFTTIEGTEHDSSFVPCFISRVAGINYLNLANDIDMTKNQISLDASLLEKIHDYSILKYEIKDNVFVLTTADDSFLKKAITAGSVKGEGTSVTAGSDELAPFLEKNHEQVFPAKNAVRFSPL
jgi:hypothetical protein